MDDSEVPPQMIGKYPVESRLKAGGMGVVYRASHPVLNFPVLMPPIAGHRSRAARPR